MKPNPACLVLLVACGGAATIGGDSDVSQTPEMMAAALVHLITVDNTFGTGAPFTEYLVLDETDPFAGDVTGTASGGRPLTEAERGTIEDAIAEYGPVRWIADPAEYSLSSDSAPTADTYPVMLGVGEPTVESHTGLVPVSLVCGNLCATWLTYRLAMVDKEWAVTGIEGPVAIS